MRRPLVLVGAAVALLIAGLATLLLAPRERTPAAHERPEIAGAADLDRAPDLDDAREPLRPAAGPDPTDEEPADAARLAAIVRVLSSTGVVLHGPRVTLELVPVGGPSRPVRSRPDASGAYALEGLAPGTWTVRAKAPQHAEGQASFVVVAGAPPLDVEVLLQAREVVRVVILTPRGDPFPSDLDPDVTAGIEVAASREQPDRFLGEALPDGEPACSVFYPRDAIGLDARTFGLLAIRCERPLLVHAALGQVVLATEVLTHGMDEIVFTLDPVVVASSAVSLVFSTVDATSLDPLRVAASLTTGLGRHRMSSPVDGRHEITTVPGPATLRIVREGYEDTWIELELQRGERRDLGDLRLARQRTGDVVVEIRAPDDGPFHLFWKRLDDLEGDPFTWVERESPESISTHALPFGRWVVQAWDERGILVSPRELVVVAEGRRSVSLELARRAPVELRAAQRRTVLVTDAFGVPVQGEERVGPDPYTLELAPGRYRAIVRTDDRPERTVEFVVTTQGATVDLP